MFLVVEAMQSWTEQEVKLKKSSVGISRYGLGRWRVGQLIGSGAMWDGALPAGVPTSGPVLAVPTFMVSTTINTLAVEVQSDVASVATFQFCLCTMEALFALMTHS